MPNLFARQTALKDVSGRIDYISNPLKQEHLLATYDTAADLLDGRFWDVLAKESQEAFEKYGQKSRMVKDWNGDLIEQELSCVEAREIFFQLGNELLGRMTPDEILQTAVDSASKALNRPVTAALHYNKKMSSLHIHMIYPERELLDEPVIKVADRALFFDAEGKRHYKKSEILDENKQLLPGCRIVAKGEIYETRCFGAADEKFSRKGWLKEFKRDWLLQIRNGELKGDVEITEYDPSTGLLPQMHVGKDKPAEKAARIREYNALVREYNQYVMDGQMEPEWIDMIQGDVLKAWNKDYMLEEYIKQLRKLIEKAEEKRRSLDLMIRSSERSRNGVYWQRYAEIRDETWTAFLQAQRTEIQAIKECRMDLNYLYELKENGGLTGSEYSSARRGVNQQLDKHKTQLRTQRKYQEIAKERQKIVRALLIAGADQADVESAMKEYEKAMRLLQTYVNDPDYDFQGRRLKVAQWSLAQAKARAEKQIQQIEAKKLEEESRLEQITDAEYQAFEEDKEPEMQNETAAALEEKKAMEPER